MDAGLHSVIAMYRKSLFALTVAGLLIALRLGSTTARVEHSGTVAIERPLMGTVWKIEVVDHGRGTEARRAIDAAYAELERIDGLMSEWKPASPLSHINAAAGKAPVEVPEELRAILERSIRYGEKSEGTFDITWHGMANIWHFDDRFVVPSESAVAAARRNVNFRDIKIDGNRVFLPRAGMSIGLGGIAKGYAVDRAAAVLARAGFTDSLVDGGGDVRVSGSREDGTAWRLGIQDPRQEHGSMLGIVWGSNRAICTSGDYERYRIVNGRRYHHIIDPRTGWPASQSMSVTVIADTAERAVVLAKPMFILGAEKGLALARAERVDALIIDSAGERHSTEGFASVFEAQ